MLQIQRADLGHDRVLQSPPQTTVGVRQFRGLFSKQRPPTRKESIATTPLKDS
jgi:hypothetical protein